MSTDSDGSHDDGGNEEFERLVQAVKRELKDDDEFGSDPHTMTRRASLGALLGLGGGFGLAGMTGNAQAAGESWGSASGTIGTDSSPLQAANILDVDVQDLQVVDTGTSPSSAGQFRQNAGDVEVFSGGGVKNLSNIGSGGGTSFPTSEDLQVEKSRGLSGGTQVENTTWTLEQTYRNTLPKQGFENGLPVHTDDLNINRFAEATAYGTIVHTGSESSYATASAGTTISNGTGSQSEAYKTTHQQPPAPFVFIKTSIESTSSAWDNGSTSSDPIIGVGKDGTNRIQLAAEHYAGEFAIYTEIAGSGTRTVVGSSLPSGEYDLGLALYNDTVMAYIRRDPSDGWEYLGGTTFSGVNLLSKSEWASWSPSVGYNLDAGESVTVSNLEVGLAPLHGFRDPRPVTYRDGQPYTTGGGSTLYFTASCAGPGNNLNSNAIGLTYQGVFKTDVTQHSPPEMVGALFTDPGDGSVYNDYASHLRYNQDADEWEWFTSGWAQSEYGGDTNTRSYVGVSDTSLLNGIHVVPVTDMNLPGTGTNIVYDPFVIDDGSGSTRCLHNNQNTQMVVSEKSKDGTYTSGWSSIYSKTSTDIIEGGTVTKVDGEYITTHADVADGGPQSTDWPDISSNEQPLSRDVAANQYSWAPIAPVEIGDTVRYLQFGFNYDGAFGLGTYSHGSLFLYEADQTATGGEFPYRSVFR